MRKLLKSLACFATAALVGASALAGYGWYGGAMSIGGTTTDCTAWSTDNDNPTDLGDLTDMTFSSIAFNVWSDANDRGGANMGFRVFDSSHTEIGVLSHDDFWLGESTRISGDHDFAISWTGEKDLAAAVGLTLEPGQVYYIDMWAKTYGTSGDEWYSGVNGGNYHAKLTYREPQTVTFNWNGAPLDPIGPFTYPIGGEYDGDGFDMACPVWEGHVWRGWYTQATGGSRVKKGTEVEDIDELELWGHWADAQTVILDADGGQGAPASILGIVGELYWCLPTPVKDGYTFMGWYADGEGDDGSRIKNGISVVPAMSERTLTAHWAGRQTVTLNANGGTCTPTSKTCYIGEFYWGLPMPVKDGFTFMGWYADDDDGSRVKNGIARVPDMAARTLTAHWAGRQTVYFEANGGTCTPTSKTCYIGEFYWGLPTPAKDGNTFIGWYADDDDGSRIKAGIARVTDAAERKLYAHWKENAAATASKAAKGRRSTTVTDTIVAGILAATSTSYTEFSGVDKTEDGINSDAVYKGKSSKSNNGGVQLRTTGSDCGIVTTVSGGTAKTVTVTWESTPASGRGLEVYGKTSAYTAATELFDDAKKGTLIDTIADGTPLEISGDYTYIGLRSKSGAIYATKIEIEWAPAVTTPTVTLEASATEVYVNEAVTINASAEGFTVGADQLTWTWKVDGTVDTTQTSTNYNLDTSAANTYVVTAEATDTTSTTNASVTITVKAPATAHDVVIVTDDHGTVTAEPTSAMEGQTVTLTVEPDEDYRLDYFETEPEVEITNLSFVMPDENVDVYAFFEGKHDIDVYTDGNGTAVADVSTAFSGATITLTVNPKPGYALDTITVTTLTEEENVPVEGKSFVMPKDDVIVDVTFKEAVEFEKITSLDNLKPGEYVITGAASSDAAEYAMKASVNTSGSNPYIERQGTAVEVSGSSVFDPDASIVWTLAQVDNGWTIFNEDVGYVAFLGPNNKNAASAETPYTDKSTWTITVDSGLFVVHNVASNRYLKYNSNSGQERFACYTSGQKNLAFYKKVEAVPMQTVTFDWNGAPLDPIGPYQYAIGGKYAGEGFDMACPVWEGHVWRGWYTAANGGTRIKAGMDVEDIDALELWGHWADAQTVILDADGGQGAPASILGIVGELYWCLPTPVKDGYTFMGWYADGEGDDGSRIKNGISIVPAMAERTLTAHWAGRQTVTLNANGGTCTPTSKTCYIGEFYWGLPTPVKDGFTFMGWYADGEGDDGSRVKNGISVVPDMAERTLTAHWAGRQTVYFEANGGTCTPTSKTCYIGEFYWGLPTPTKDGSTFIGWYADDDDGSRVKAGIARVTDAAERKLYAHWKGGASTLNITAFAMTPRAAAPAARSASPATVECTLWFGTVAGTVYEVLWTPSMDGEWTLLKRWTAEEDGEVPVTVEIPADAATGFFRLVQPDGE